MRVKFNLLAAAGVLLLSIATVLASALPESTAPASTAIAYSGDDDGDPREGRRIFLRENCYGCHGGRAGGGMCPSLREERPDDDEVRKVVRNGTPNGMPPFPQLTERDIQNLAAYFDTLRHDDEPTFTHWWEPFPTR
jgi:mono/diheme cytochrome c family protein